MATAVERVLAQSRANESDDPALFMHAFHSAVEAVLLGDDTAAWLASQLIGPAAVAGHIEGVAAVRARKAPRRAFAVDSLAWKHWPLRSVVGVA